MLEDVQYRQNRLNDGERRELKIGVRTDAMSGRSLGAAIHGRGLYGEGRASVWDSRRGEEGRGGGRRSAAREAFGDIPFEFVGQIAGACAMAKAGDVQRGASTRRHGEEQKSWTLEMGGIL
jgi:hypothetical protein